ALFSLSRRDSVQPRATGRASEPRASLRGLFWAPIIWVSRALRLSSRLLALAGSLARNSCSQRSSVSRYSRHRCGVLAAGDGTVSLRAWHFFQASRSCGGSVTARGGGGAGVLSERTISMSSASPLLPKRTGVCTALRLWRGGPSV